MRSFPFAAPALLAVACAIAGCTPPARSRESIAVAPARTGVVAALRPLPAASAATAAVLRAAGESAAEPSDRSQAAAGAWVELVISVDDGSTISVVEPNRAGFRRGERVRVLDGPDTAITPLQG